MSLPHQFWPPPTFAPGKWDPTEDSSSGKPHRAPLRTGTEEGFGNGAGGLQSLQRCPAPAQSLDEPPTEGRSADAAHAQLATG